MLRTDEYTESAYRLFRGFLMMRREDEHTRRGNYSHPEGLIEVFENSYPKLRQAVTSMYFVRDGYSYVRRWDATWSDRTLARLARIFIEDITSER